MDLPMDVRRCKSRLGPRDHFCCPGYFGHDCFKCPGTVDNWCSNNGRCLDGLFGSGECLCNEGFHGTACETCEAGRYGKDCKSACNCTANGKCDEGLDGNGSCFCQESWTGTWCESKIAPDLCSEYNGGCHAEANSGYTGDGNLCSPINRCVEEVNGGCSDFADCIVTGPNERRCECQVGYVGNGVQCLEKVVPPVDRCLEDNGGCHPKATCKDLHFHTKTAGVFHLRSPAGKYKMNYTTAEAACRAEEATLATLSQLSDAQQLGMHLCTAGWMDGKKVGYPIRFPSVKCGDNHVGIVLYKDPVDLSSPYDAYCYRVRDVECECGPGYIGNGEFCNGNLASVIATNSNFSVFYSVSSLNLSPSTSFRFRSDLTLSWRDMEYHISTNNSLCFYEDLKHNTAIPSRLGFNLIVVIDSSPLKLINKQVILDWDIPANNGLIHIIQGPLRAPPAPVMLLIIFIGGAVAGVAYYFLKHKNDAFRFQYFRQLAQLVPNHSRPPNHAHICTKSCGPRESGYHRLSSQLCWVFKQN
uniref:Stabilin 1 n=1 Tax=Astyanax mexicanus TaxID=7994 RepID=A0A3B1JS75_ASTMX